MSITLDGTLGITTPTYGGAVTAEYSVPVTAFKNRILNGQMVIDQRNAGASVLVTGTNWSVDRWAAFGSVTSKFTVQQNAGTVATPAGFKNYMGFTSSSAYPVGASENFRVQQPIEGFNTSDFGWGAAGAATVTLSFWARSSLTGTFGGAFVNENADRSYPFTYTISSANTWEYKTVTVAGDTTGTWTGATNGLGIRLYFNLGAGSTVSGTANTWQSGFYTAPTGAVSVVGTNLATFYITGVQLEKGSTATSFDYRPYGTELQLCQRYFEKMGGDVSTDMYFNGYQSASTDITWPIYYKANKRASPTATVVGTWNTGNNGGVNVQGLGITTCTFRLTATSTGTTFAHTTGTSTYLTFSSEL